MKEIKLVSDSITTAVGPAMLLESMLPNETPDFDALFQIGTSLKQQLNTVKSNPKLSEEEKNTQTTQLEIELTPIEELLRLQITATKLPLITTEEGANKVVMLRNVNGDGNCYYRALLQAYLENEIAAGKLASLTELAELYKTHHQNILTDIIFKEGQQQKLISPRQFSSFIQIIQQAETTEQQQQLLVKAFNHEKVRFDLSAVALSRYLILTNAQQQLKEGGFATEEHIDNFKQMNTDIKDGSLASSIFAQEFNIQVRNISLSEDTDNPVYDPYTVNDETGQIAVVHNINHYLAGRTQAVQNTMQDYTTATVKGLENITDGQYHYDESEITARENEFKFLEESSTSTQDTGNQTMATESEINQMTTQQEELEHSIATLSALLTTDREIKDEAAAFAELDGQQELLDELDLSNPEKHQALKELLLTEGILEQSNQRLHFADSGFSKFEAFLNTWDQNELHAAEQQKAAQELRAELNKAEAAQELRAELNKAEAAQELREALEEKYATAEQQEPAATELVNEEQPVDKETAAEELHQALTQLEQTHDAEQTATATLVQTQQVTNLFTNQEEFSTFANQVLDPQQGELNITATEQGFKAQSGNTDITYDKSTESLTTHGDNAVQLLAKAIEEFAKQRPGVNLVWELSAGIKADDVTQHFSSDEIKSRVSFTEKNEASATFKGEKVEPSLEEPTDTSSDKNTATNLVDTQDEPTEQNKTTDQDVTNFIIDNEDQFRDAIGARFGQSSTGVHIFVENNSEQLTTYLTEKNKQLPDHVKPYLTELFDEAITQDKTSLATAIAKHLPPAESESKLNTTLNNEDLNSETKQQLASALLENQSLSLAVPGKMWGVSQSLDNLQKLIGDEKLESVLKQKLEQETPSIETLTSLFQHAIAQDRLDIATEIYSMMGGDKAKFTLSANALDVLLSPLIIPGDSPKDDLTVQQRVNLAVSVAKHLSPEDSEKKLNTLLHDQVLNHDTTQKLASALLTKQGISTAAPGQMWGVNQSLDNLLRLTDGGQELEAVLKEKLTQKLPSRDALETLIQHAAEKNRGQLVHEIYQIIVKKAVFAFSDKTVDTLLLSKDFSEKLEVGQLNIVHAAQLLEATVTSEDTVKRHAIPALLQTILNKPKADLQESEKVRSALKATAKFLAESVRDNKPNVQYYIENKINGEIDAETLVKLASTLYDRDNQIASNKEEHSQLLQQIAKIMLEPENNYLEKETKQSKGIINALIMDKVEHQALAYYLLNTTGALNQSDLVEPLLLKSRFSNKSEREQLHTLQCAASNPNVMAELLRIGKDNHNLREVVRTELANQLIQEEKPPAATNTLMFHPQGGILALINKGETKKEIISTQGKHVTRYDGETQIVKELLPVLHYLADELNEQGLTDTQNGVEISDEITVKQDQVVEFTNHIIESDNLTTDEKIDLVKKLVDLPANADNAENIKALLQKKKDEILEHRQQKDGNVTSEVLEMLQSFDGVAVLTGWLTQKATEADKPAMEQATHAILALQNYVKALESRWISTDESRHSTVQAISQKALRIFTAANKQERLSKLEHEIDKVTPGKLKTELKKPSITAAPSA